MHLAADAEKKQNCRCVALPSGPVKVSEVLRLLADDGWQLDRVRGSHRQYRHPDKPGTVTVPGKPSDELHPKTRNSILRQAGLR